MNVGFKTGPKNWEEGMRIVTEHGARLCEMWFRIDRAAAYDDRLSWLKKHEVRTGLHHWGVAAGKYKTNLATNNTDIRQETIQQIKDTIDVGAKIDCAYVNAHPGAAQVEKLDLVGETQEPVAGEITDPEESAALFLSAAEGLQAYAVKKGVLLTLETLPAREQYALGDRSRLYNPCNVPLAVMGKLGAQGNFLANDTTHTLAAVSVQASNQENLWQTFMQFARAAAPFTHLLHINTLLLPHDGSDSHDGVTADDFAKNVAPTREQILEFLRVFAGREDVFVIPEPRNHMKENYLALQALVNSL